MLPPKPPQHLKLNSTNFMIPEENFNSTSFPKIPQQKLSSQQVLTVNTKFLDHQNKFSQTKSRPLFSFQTDLQKDSQRENNINSNSFSGIISNEQRQKMYDFKLSTPQNSSNITSSIQANLFERLRNYHSSSAQNSRTTLQSTEDFLKKEIPTFKKTLNTDEPNYLFRNLNTQNTISQKQLIHRLSAITDNNNNNIQNQQQQDNILNNKIRFNFINNITHTQSTTLIPPIPISNKFQKDKTQSSNNIYVVTNDKIQTGHYHGAEISSREEQKPINNFAEVLSIFSQKKKQDKEYLEKQFKFLKNVQNDTNQPIYSFQKCHPNYIQQKIKYSLNAEQEQQLQQFKKQKEQQDLVEQQKAELEQEKVQKNLVDFMIINVKERIMDKQQYLQELEKQKKIVDQMKERINQGFIYKSLDIYKILVAKIQISKFFTQYCMTIYKEYVRQKEAIKMFDEINSASPSPLKKKKISNGQMLSRSSTKNENSNLNPRVSLNSSKVLQLWSEDDLMQKKLEKQLSREIFTKQPTLVIKATKKIIDEEENDDDEEDYQNYDFNKIIEEEEKYQELKLEEEFQQENLQKKSKYNIQKQKTNGPKKEPAIKFIKKKKVNML